MNLYLITRKGTVSYCQYRGAVIAATDEEAAKEILFALDDDNEELAWDFTIVSHCVAPGFEDKVILTDYCDG